MRRAAPGRNEPVTFTLNLTAMPTVGAFAVILDAEAKLLLCHRRDRDEWNLPGGRVEKGESPWEAVVREVLEEVGLEVRVERLLGVYSVSTRDDIVFNVLCTPVGGTLGTTSEADRVEWFNRSAIPANTSRRHVERIEEAYARPNSVALRVQV